MLNNKSEIINIVSKKTIFNTVFSQAKTVYFFSAKKINRNDLFHDRGLLKARSIKLQKANNYSLEQALIKNKLLPLLSVCTSYNFVAFSNQIITKALLKEVYNLPYVNIIMTGVLVNNKFLTSGRILQEETTTSVVDASVTNNFWNLYNFYLTINSISKNNLITTLK